MSEPKWYEAMIGAGMLAAATFAAMHILHHPDHGHVLYSWAFVAAFALAGLWLITPVRARSLWRELRNSIPFLQDVEPD